MLESIGSFGRAAQGMLDTPGRLARGLTVKLKWQMANLEAPAAPSRLLQQYGVVRSPVYAENVKTKDADGRVTKIRYGWCYVRPTQYEYADHVLRKEAIDYIVISPPHPNNEHVQPTGMGKSWGAPTRATGISGMIDDLVAGGFGYRFERKQGKWGVGKMIGSFRFPAISGMVRRRSSKPKSARRSRRR